MNATVPPPRSRFRAWDITLLLVVSVVWGAAYVFIRQGLALGAAPLEFAAARYALAAAAFALVALAQREPLPSRRSLLASASVGGILIIGLYGGLLYSGEQYTTGGYAAVLASTAPIMTVGLGYWILSSERLGARGLLGIAVGFVGAVVLVVPQLAGTPIGTGFGPLFILLAMLCTVTGTVVLRRLGLGRQGLWLIGSQFLVAALLLAVGAAVIPEHGDLPVSEGVLANLAALVVFSSLLGYFAYFTLHHRVGPVRANLVAYLVPIVGVAIGSGAFGEPLTGWELGGVAIVLGGVSLALWESSQRESHPST